MVRPHRSGPDWILLWQRLKERLYHFVSWILNELEPWFKWLVYQAILSVLLRWIVKRVQTLGPWLDAAGLLQAMAGTITADQFAVGAQRLAATWNSLVSTQGCWQWKSGTALANSQDPGYLDMQQPVSSRVVAASLHPAAPDKRQSSDCTLGLVDANPVQHVYDISNDPASQVAEESSGGIHMYKYHILYHSSYCVPMMMFKAHQPDGQLLPWDQILIDLPPLFSHTAAAHEQWTFVTQQDHPYEMTPWHMLHPCGTEHAMQLLMAGLQRPAERTLGPRSEGSDYDAVYLLAWLSMVGPLLSAGYEMQTSCRGSLPASTSGTRTAQEHSTSISRQLFLQPGRATGSQAALSKHTRSRRAVQTFALFDFFKRKSAPLAAPVVRPTVIPEPSYNLSLGFAGIATLLALDGKLIGAALPGILAAFLAFQTSRVRFLFTDDALEVRAGSSEDPQENAFVGGESRWTYGTFTNWEFWWPKFPILVYFKENQTKPEGQIHFFPVLFNGKQVYDVMVERCGNSQTSLPKEAAAE
ncbi:hypothetical protein WJX73_000557 [Symbiochloris irregularis]|uniref:Uncharacterized protein n=1 Tax=Symbiochloris irregularis TaxID=706552 RepID=A0AAW1NZ71_9CHLO